jgi:hypothetical protein
MRWFRRRIRTLDGGFAHHAPEGQSVIAHSKAAVALFVDKSGRRWIARDADGRFWVIPPGDDPWENRQPFDLPDDVELEPVPGHYKYMLGLSP